MVPLYSLRFAITSLSDETDQSFLSRAVPCLSHLYDLKESFDRRRDVVLSGVRIAKVDGCYRWRLNGAVGISVGKERAVGLCRLYEAMLRLIALQLPDDIVEGQISKLQIS